MADKEYSFLEGVCLWAEVHRDREQENDKGVVETWCQLLMECDKSYFNKLKQKGLSPNTKLYPAEEVFGTDKDTGEFKPIPEDIKDLVEGKHFIRIKRKVSGVSKTKGPFNLGKPKVIDIYGNPFTQDIGNGSTVRVKFQISPYTVKGINRIKLVLIAVQVKEHLEFVRQDRSLEGFDIQEAPNDSSVSLDDVDVSDL